MTKATPDQQQQLLELQAVDTAVRRLEHRRAHLPEQQALDECEATLRKVTGELATAREDLERTEKAQSRLEGEIQTVESRRKSEEGRMFSGQITSERELSAIRGELGSLKTRKGDLEDQLLEVMERREELESLVEELTRRRKELTEQAQELGESRDHAATDIDAELAERRTERGELAGAMPADLLEFYDRLRERKDGLAVAELHGRTCQGCRLELTATELEDVKDQAKGGMPRCEQCERILVPAG